MPKVGRTLAGVLVAMASALASAESVDWVGKDVSGTLVAGGRAADGTVLFVCRAAAADGGVLVGKVAMSGERAGECEVPAPQGAQALTQFELLVERPAAEAVYKWVPGHAASFPQRSVLAGQAADGRRWLVCAGLNMVDGSVHPGYILDENCVYSQGGAQRVADTYLVLASNDADTATTEEAQPAFEGFDPNAILAASGVARFCALAEARCARTLPEPPAATAAN